MSEVSMLHLHWTTGLLRNQSSFQADTAFGHNIRIKEIDVIVTSQMHKTRYAYFCQWQRSRNHGSMYTAKLLFHSHTIKMLNSV